ncbi:MAG: hypothetical protein V4604_14170 [Bacteroidota bacterium]
MKTTLTFTFAVLFNLTFVHAQIALTKNPIVVTDTSKTIFVYRDSDENSLDKLKKVLDDNWSYNEIELMSIDDFANLEMKENDFVFMIEYDHQQVAAEYSDGSYGPTGNFVDFYLALSQKRKKGYGYNIISRSVVSISGPTMVDVCRTDKTEEEIIHNQYKTATVFSWNYAYLATIMHTLSNQLPESTTSSPIENPTGDLIKVYSSIENPDGNLAGLKEKKLYITDGIEIKQNRFNGSEKTIDQEAAVDKAYDYQYEIVSNEKLNDLVTSGEKGYVFMFQKIGRGKVSIVLDLSTMEIIYHHREYNKYAFDKKDISRLNNAIAKTP